jgi:acetate kinase
MACEDMEFFGIKIDKEKNQNFTRGIPFDISADDARVRTWIIPTDEEYMIAKDTEALVK